MTIPKTTNDRTKISKQLLARFGSDNPQFVAPVIAQRVREWAKVRQSPRLLENILSKLNVPFYYTNRANLAHERQGEAFLRFVDGELSLEIDRNSFRSNRGRARFSIAHEIGHLALIHIYGNDVISWAEENQIAYDQVEALCDQIASHVLMPRELVRDHFRKHGLNTFGVHSALKIFGVSKQALLTGIADTQSSTVAFNFRRFARHENENSEWRVANVGVSSDNGTSAPWKARGSTLSKHLEIDCDLNSLEPDYPWVGKVRWKTKSEVREFQTVLCKMDTVDSNQIDQIVLDEIADYSRIKQDVFDGIVAVVGSPLTQDIGAFYKDPEV